MNTAINLRNIIKPIYTFAHSKFGFILPLSAIILLITLLFFSWYSDNTFTKNKATLLFISVWLIISLALVYIKL